MLERSITAPAFWRYLSALCPVVVLLGSLSFGQEVSKDPPVENKDLHAANREQLNVNWFYGAYVPKDAPLETLTGRQRQKLFRRQTFTTPGIYLKSGFLALIDQAKSTPYEWGGGFDGYGRRLISNYGRSAIQNVFSTAGNAALLYEPRYDRCHCEGLGKRSKHALLRNFLTYNRTEREWRPQFALYGAAMGAGMLSSVWTPRDKLWSNGYNSVLTQAAFGMMSNWVGEFAPEIRRKLRHENPQMPIEDR